MNKINEYYNKISIMALLFGAMFVFTQVANAETSYVSQTKVAVAPTSAVPNSGFCYAWTRNLRIEDSGSDVVMLSQALGLQGFNISMEQKGVFGDTLASAVVGFQQKYASEILTPNGLSYGTGYVGPATRAKLNALYGCKKTPIVSDFPTTSSTITVLSPNGGESLMINSSQTIKWYDSSKAPVCPAGAYCMIAAPKTYDIKLISDTYSTYSVANAVNSTFYSWTVGNLAYGNTGSITLNGKYKVQVCQAGTNDCDTSDGYVAIYGKQRDIEIPPSIITDSIDSQNPGAGLSLAKDASLVVKYLPDVKEDRAGAWEQFRANGNNDYVNRGILTLNSTKTIKNILFSTNIRGLAGYTSITQKVDGVGMYPAVVLYDGSQINSAYDQTLGTYGPGTHMFTVYDESTPNDGPYQTFGLTFYFTDDTYVTGTTSGTAGNVVVNMGNPNITLVAGKSTENGEIYSGGAIVIQGTNLAGYKGSANVYINGNECAITQISNTLIYCTVPSSLKAGEYDLYINTIGIGGDKVTSNIVRVRVLGNIIQPPIIKPVITVLSPNGGETFIKGSTQSITWLDSSIVPSCPAGAYCSQPMPKYYNIKLVPLNSTSSYSIAENVYGRSYSWTIGKNIPEGQYKMQVCLMDGTVCDSSNSYFKIFVATETTPPATQSPSYQ